MELELLDRFGDILMRINLDFYNGEDGYSDGEIEDEILEIITKNEELQKVIQNDNRWPLLYHLSPIRRNLLEWIDISPESRVLEVGAGCGALTGLLCEKAKDVVAVELSRRRAEIISQRHHKYSNLEIIVGNLNDIELPEESFDYITLIGVLEYAGAFTSDKDPYKTFLRNIRNKMKRSGTLIVAIENKFGLKYWAGAREDHTNKFFDGLENYPHTSEVKTFSKNELYDMLAQIGYSEIDFYYPVPDYKMPVEIYSDYYLPRIGSLKSFGKSYDADRLQLFNEKLVCDNLISENMFPFFSNSFLVVCRNA